MLGRLTRAHAWLLTCTCTVIVLFNAPARNGVSPIFSWPTSNSANESQIDSALQQAAQDALGDREGSIVIMDAQTGRVRASVNMEAAYAQAMMPGSSIKPFTTLAALRAGLVDENSHTTCPGRFTGLSFSLPCVHADHLPPFTPSQAIAYSCNYYFATLGQRLGREHLSETLRQFGFGQATGIAGDEAIGTVKPCASGDTTRVRSGSTDEASQQADCAAREAIGESERIQVTPIQLLTAYAALLNGGHLFQPQSRAADDFHFVERSQVNVSSEERRIVLEGMSGAIRYGTARGARLDSVPLTILGKTGTAIPPKGFRTNGWFVGLAGPANATRELPSADVQLAVIVFLPRAHGAQAAQISRPIFEAYANEISHRDTEARSVSNVQSVSEDSNFSSPSPRLHVSPSSVRVHLVTENITRELSLEDYVTGVMRAEGTMETEPEALKALAISIRTFALKNAGRHAKDGYDFCSTTHCQRFVLKDPTVTDGTNVLNVRLTAAIHATEGQVLLDDHGELIDSYFGASCGGETADIATLWGISPETYLTGTRDEFCDSGPHAHWTDVISRADLLRALQADSRTDVGHRLDQLVISKRDDTGRAEFITIEGEQRRVVRGWDFKIIVGRTLGWNVLKSSRFEVSRNGSSFVFRGSGFGHGLGLCQEGAHVMASRGANYQRILEKYFPGTRVGREGEMVRRGDTASANSRSQWKPDVLPLPLEEGRGEGLATNSNRFDFYRYHSIGTGKRKLFLSYPSLASPLTPALSQREREHATRFVTISSEHFRVTYPADIDRRDVNQVLTILENARADYLRRAGNPSGPPVLDIRINESTGDFAGRTGQPWWAAAATKGNKIELQPVAILKRRGVLNTTLKHELAHVIIDIVSHDRAPRWLEEGFAIYLAGEGALYSHGSREMLTEDELEKRLEHPTSQTVMRVAYTDAYLKVKEMTRNGGEASVWKRLTSSSN